MELTNNERTKITDSMHSIQSARASLADMKSDKIPEIGDIQKCLEGADKNLRAALRSSSRSKA